MFTTSRDIQPFHRYLVPSTDGRHGYVYVLRLRGGRGEQDKYYVGSTKDPHKRIADQLSGRGAKITQRHPSDAIELESIKRMSSGASARRVETTVYLELKNKHGKDNVRGAVRRCCFEIVVCVILTRSTYP
jgi:predicted GIY-YIG superfamily endonuclease